MKNGVLLLLWACIFLFWLPLSSKSQSCTPVAVTKTDSTKVYVHYMPWFFAPRNPVSGTNYTVNSNATGSWGFHWCEDGSKANPNTFTSITDYTGTSVQARNVDAHFHPLIGPYDGSDPNVLEYHLLLMKLSGIDGVMIDWYGLSGNGSSDAGANQVNSAALIAEMGTFGLKYGLVVEDGSMTNLSANLAYAASNYFTDANYIKLGDMRGSSAANATAPVVAEFEPYSYTNVSSWSNLGNTKAFLPLYDQAYNSVPTIAGGTFMWPYPQAGQGTSSAGTPNWFYNTSSYYAGNATTIHNNFKENGVTLYNNVVLGTAYQGFFDFYLSNASSYTNPNANCTTCDQYGIIPRNYGPGGNTLDTTLKLAQLNKGVIDGIQIATWNDFSEGTIIEPTVEYGFQSLVTIQKFTGVSYTEKDLRYVDTLFMLRKQYASNSAIQTALNQVSCDIASLKVSAAESMLRCIVSTGGACTVPSITSSSAVSDTVNSPLNYQITASNSPNSYSASGLPTGVTINTSTGVISGTPVTVGTYSVTIGATNSSGTGSQMLTITVNQSSAELPYGGTPATIPGTIQAENYDDGGQAVAYNDSDPTNDGGQYRLAEGVDIETSTDTGGGYDVNWTVAGEWMQYTVNVTEAGIYTLQVRAGSPSSGNTLYITMDGVNISGTITVPNTGGYQTWQTINVTTPMLTAGLHKMRIVETTGGYSLNYVTYSVSTLDACTNASDFLIATAPASGNTYQWQVNTGSGYSNINNTIPYSGVTTDTLILNNAPSSMYGYLYRCAVTNNSILSYSPVYTLQFVQTWTGAKSTAWETAGNWSCDIIPDANTDVIFNSGTAIINSAVTIRTLSINTATTHLTVNTGHNLIITH